MLIYNYLEQRIIQECVKRTKALWSTLLSATV